MIKITTADRPAQLAVDIETLGIHASEYGIEAPSLRTNYVTIPGRNGNIDLTEALGSPTYDSRMVTFAAMYYGNAGMFQAKISSLMNTYNGKVLKVVFANDSEYYWKGRCEISHKRVDASTYIIVFSITADPYKRSIWSSNEEWLWDPFNFESGVIRQYTDLEVPGTYRVVAYSTPETPTVYLENASGTVTLKVSKHGEVGQKTFTLRSGSNRLDGLEVISVNPQNDYYTFQFTGSAGDVDIQISGGSL